MQNPDPSHDMLHVKRVVKNARVLCEQVKACWEIVMPAAYLHDVVYVSKASSQRAKASQLSAKEAMKFLREIAYPFQHIEAVGHAIASHSYSADLEAKTIEAKIVQDADRLDAIGAVGIARCFAFSGLALRPLHDAEDPFADERELDDSQNTLDHFYKKLLKVPEKMQTEEGRSEAKARLVVMDQYLQAFRSELGL